MVAVALNNFDSLVDVWESDCISALRNSHEVFPTGSRIYGEPHEHSDWDFVLLCHNYEDMGPVDSLLGKLGFIEGGSLRPGDKWTSYKSSCGRLNVIVAIGETQFENWMVARDYCEERAPLPKPECIRVHQMFEAGV